MSGQCLTLRPVYPWKNVPDTEWEVESTLSRSGNGEGENFAQFPDTTSPLFSHSTAPTVLVPHFEAVVYTFLHRRRKHYFPPKVWYQSTKLHNPYLYSTRIILTVLKGLFNRMSLIINNNPILSVSLQT